MCRDYIEGGNYSMLCVGIKLKEVITVRRANRVRDWQCIWEMESEWLKLSVREGQTVGLALLVRERQPESCE